jgi:hypothetical protein
MIYLLVQREKSPRERLLVDDLGCRTKTGPNPFGRRRPER